MLHLLPSILYGDFTKEVFVEVLKIYASVSGIKNPCVTSVDPSGEMHHILCALVDRNVCEFRLGSSLTRHSKLYLRIVIKKDGRHTAFDFYPNTSDDSLLEVVTMREKFNQKVQEYLDTLPKSLN